MKELKDLNLIDSSKLNALDESKISVELKDAEKKLFALKMKLNAWELKQTHLISFLKKYIAKIRTIANAKGFKA